MASENLVIELWEIVQKENNEKISYNDFENDLNKALNLPKDEIDRALSLMISQAEINSNLIGEYKGGAFTISSSFAASIISTIKYENQFIPGKVEFETRNTGERILNDAVVTAALIMTPNIVDNMIDNYQTLSDEERICLWQKYSDMDFERKMAMIEAHKETLQSIIRDPNTPPEIRVQAQNDYNSLLYFGELEKSCNEGIGKIEPNADLDGSIKSGASEQHEGKIPPLTRDKMVEVVSEFRKRNLKSFNLYFPNIDNIEELSDEVLSNIHGKIGTVMAAYQSLSNGFSNKLHNDSRTQGVAGFEDGIEFTERKSELINAAPLKKFVLNDNDKFSGEIDYETMMQWGKSAGEIFSEVRLTEKSSDLVHQMIMMDSLLDRVDGTTKDKTDALDVFKNLISNLSKDEVSDFDISLSSLLETELAQLVLDGSVRSIVENLIKHSGLLLLAIRENRDAVVDKVLTPYLDGKSKNRTVEDIANETFTDMSKSEISYMISRYSHMIDLKRENTEKEDDSFKYNNADYKKNFFNIVDKEDKEKIIAKGMQNGRTLKELKTEKNAINQPITQKEYEGATQGKEEEIVVDETGLKAKQKEIRDVSPTILNYNLDDIAAISASMKQASRTERRPRRPRKEVENEVDNSQEKKLEETEVEDKKEDVQNESSTDVTNSAQIETSNRPKVYIFNPKDPKKLKDVRSPEVMNEMDTLKLCVELYEARYSGKGDNQTVNTKDTDEIGEVG